MLSAVATPLTVQVFPGSIGAATCTGTISISSTGLLQNGNNFQTALKFIDRALSLMSNQKVTDFSLYQNLIELRVQVLMVRDVQRGTVLWTRPNPC